MLAVVATVADCAPRVAPVPVVAEAAWMPMAPDWRQSYREGSERAKAAEERPEKRKPAELDVCCDACSRRLPKDVRPAVRSHPLQAIPECSNSRNRGQASLIHTDRRCSFLPLYLA